MRRRILIAAFALVLALPVWAQRGARSGGFSGHSGSNGGHAGGGHFSGGVRSGSAFSRGLSRTSRAGLAGHPSLHDRFRGPRIRTGGFHRNCGRFGCLRGYGYPWAYGYYDPSWWWDSGSSYAEDYERDRATAIQMNEQSLEDQRMLRQEEAEGDRDRYARSDPAPQPAAGNAVDTSPATVLVFRDQHTQEIRNYAIVGQTLWSFSPQRTQKIPLSELDLTATTSTNDNRGISFRVPAGTEAQ